jgi:hypothetical protein
MRPKWLALGSVELAVALLRALYDAKNDEQYCLRKEAFEKTLEADRLVTLAAKVSGRPIQKPQTTWSKRGSENAKTRRLRKRAEARASAQAAQDAAAEAEVSDEQEAAAGVAIGVEEALADARQEGEKDDFAQAQAAGESEDDDNGEEEAIKFASGFPSPKRERKLSGEDQAETKRLRQDELQEEQHGSGGEDAQYGHIWERHWVRHCAEGRVTQAVWDEKWAAFWQSQAALRGEGGLGLAKGDG